jgi:thiol-disulfide isomerase/thioredoxin
VKKILVAALVAWVPVFASTPGQPGSADADWAALQSAGLLETKLPAGFFHGQTSQESSIRLEQLAQTRNKQGVAYYERHPADPRRWIVVEQMLLSRPRFITSYGPNFEHDPNDVVIDAAAAAAWQSRLDALQAALDAAPDVPTDVREQSDARVISAMLISFTNKPVQDRQGVDWTPVLSKLIAFATNYPQSDRACNLLVWAMNYYQSANPAERNAAMWRWFAEGPNRAMAEIARPHLRLFDQAVPLQFTAVDGRRVDLGKLHGKVVLLEFWATWCQPCREEIPAILANYQKYHDKGFEVVGISLESAGITPKDTAEEAAAKLAKNKKFFLNFIAANHIPWPQYFDGLSAFKNDVATRFSIDSIPSLLLLNQEGKLVSVDAHGDALEREVRKLLKL